ncbi:MAG: GNAT family N-acetyltransferase [Gammaproteobacteria bacterium]
MDAQSYRVEETLKNGMRVTIRAIRPDDRQAFLQAYQGLERQTIYLRTFGMRGDPSDEELRRWTDVDFVRTVRLVACLPQGEEEQIIAGAVYVALDNSTPPEEAEIAFTVEEDYHGLGLGRRLLKHLAKIGRAGGVRRFLAEILPQNKAMLAVFARSGLPMVKSHREGVVHIRLDLGSDDGQDRAQ